MVAPHGRDKVAANRRKIRANVDRIRSSADMTPLAQWNLGGNELITLLWRLTGFLVWEGQGIMFPFFFFFFSRSYEEGEVRQCVPTEYILPGTLST